MPADEFYDVTVFGRGDVFMMILMSLFFCFLTFIAANNFLENTIMAGNCRRTYDL